MATTIRTSGGRAAQLERMPHVMFGGLAHEPAYRLAARLAALLPGRPRPRVLRRLRLGRRGSRHEDGGAILAQSRRRAAAPAFVSFRGGYHGDTLATMAVCDPEEGMHSLFEGVMPGQYLADLPHRRRPGGGARRAAAARASEIAAMLVEPRVQGAGGMMFHDAEVLRAACARWPTGTACC